jgi:hypothetical protein
LVGPLKALLDLKLAPRLLAMPLTGGQGTFEDRHWNRHGHVELLSLESQAALIRLDPTTMASEVDHQRAVTGAAGPRTPAIVPGLQRL